MKAEVEINRRDFLRLAGAGAAGAALYVLKRSVPISVEAEQPAHPPTQEEGKQVYDGRIIREYRQCGQPTLCPGVLEFKEIPMDRFDDQGNQVRQIQPVWRSARQGEAVTCIVSYWEGDECVTEKAVLMR